LSRHIDAPCGIAILGKWGASLCERQVQWVREVADATQPFLTGGVSDNFLGEEGEDQVKAAYGSDYQCLVVLKGKYNPTHFFWLNQNIQPTV